MQFPTLKTGAVLQYPMQRVFAEKTGILRFVDGSEQRFQDAAAAMRRWIVQFDLIDDGEVQRLEEFFLALGGRLGRFSFLDPADARLYPNCSLEDDTLEFRWSGEGRASTTFSIRENKD
ncbi:MAG: DUF2460 domain-containing protein [Acidobacteria bacterium]|nr:DUF2460 domain-containing protein [Acidobacteriota bacterium]